MTIPTTDMTHGDWCYCSQCIENPKPATKPLIASRSEVACSPATCSPSDTPETRALWHETLDWCQKRGEMHDPYHAQLANLSEKLERERDEARRLLEECQKDLATSIAETDFLSARLAETREEAQNWRNNIYDCKWPKLRFSWEDEE